MILSLATALSMAGAAYAQSAAEEQGAVPGAPTYDQLRDATTASLSDVLNHVSL